LNEKLAESNINDTISVWWKLENTWIETGIAHTLGGLIG